MPEMLIPALDELEKTWLDAEKDSAFAAELALAYKTFAGRPTPLLYAANLTKRLGGAKIYLKNEGCAHTGAHKINNCIGQGILAKRMGKKNIIAETGAGQHGLATAAVAAKFNLGCKVFMGSHDIRRQQPNVFNMKILGAEVVPVTYGSKTLKDAVNAAYKYWITNLGHTHYLLGSALGAYPYPLIVREFQSIIGKEVRAQLLEAEGRGPDYLIACVGGGSNSIGLFYPFIGDEAVSLIGVEAGGKGIGAGENAVRVTENPDIGVVQGYRSYFLQDDSGCVMPTHSISAGLDYAGIGPELAWLAHEGRIGFSSASDTEVLEAFKILASEEGVIPALESAHAVAHALKIIPDLSRDAIAVIGISGRGDKDIFITAKALDKENWYTFLRTELTE